MEHVEKGQQKLRRGNMELKEDSLSFLYHYLESELAINFMNTTVSYPLFLHITV